MALFDLRLWIVLLVDWFRVLCMVWFVIRSLGFPIRWFSALLGWFALGGWCGITWGFWFCDFRVLGGICGGWFEVLRLSLCLGDLRG